MGKPTHVGYEFSPREFATMTTSKLYLKEIRTPTGKRKVWKGLPKREFFQMYANFLGINLDESKETSRNPKSVAIVGDKVVLEPPNPQYQPKEYLDKDEVAKFPQTPLQRGLFDS